jgi:hypothetical protein
MAWGKLRGNAQSRQADRLAPDNNPARHRNIPLDCNHTRHRIALLDGADIPGRTVGADRDGSTIGLTPAGQP